MRIEFVGFPPKDGHSRSDPSIMQLVPPLAPPPFSWKNKVLSMVVFFVLMAALRKILTLDNLKKRRVIMTYWCCMCKESGESIDQSFAPLCGGMRFAGFNF